MELDVLSCTFILGFIYLLYYYGVSTYSYWKKRNVVFLKPEYPFFGNSFHIAFSLRSNIEEQKIRYDYFKGNRFGGYFSFRKPELFMRDAGLIENILIKDFSYFYNRGNEPDTELDPLSAHLVHLKDAQWKSVRTKLTPTFSSGKLKGMHDQIIGCSDHLLNHMKSLKTFEARELMAKFATDVISCCAFGLNADTLNDSDSPLRNIGKRVFRSTFEAKLRFTIRTHFPFLLKLLRWRSVPLEMQKFFVDTLHNTIEHREKNNIVRPDFLHLMNELKKNDMELLKSGKISDKEVVFDDKMVAANAFVFLVAGFETTATTLSYALYELSSNQDIQEKAFKEIYETIKKHGNEPTFEAVKEMDYLDQIVSETLRKYPPVTSVSRVVSKPYQIPESSLILEKNSTVSIPIYSLHHDPEHFPYPEKFSPERFSEENKSKIKKGSYLPFGDGPRICIGLRFAKLEIKVALSKILMKYKFTLNKKTLSPLQFNKKSLFLVPVGGLWLDMEERK